MYHATLLPYTKALTDMHKWSVWSTVDQLPPIRADSSFAGISLASNFSQSESLGPKRLQTHPTSNLQSPSFLPQTPASSTPNSPGQCSFSVPPPPSPGARLPALSPSPSAPSLLPSSAVRDSYGLIRPCHTDLLQFAPNGLCAFNFARASWALDQTTS